MASHQFAGSTYFERGCLQANHALSRDRYNIDVHTGLNYTTVSELQIPFTP